MTSPGGEADELGRVLRAAAAWHAAGHGIALATVIETWGSAPRGVGSHLAVRDDGLFEGSVSGGCVEGDVITEALDLIGARGARRLDYGVADETAWRVGLACGGRISVLVQALDPARFPPTLLVELVEARTAGREFAITTDLASGRSEAGEQPGEGRFVRRYEAPARLMIVGAVHIAQHLVGFANALGVRPLVVDPRGLFAADARFEGLPIDPRWPDEALAEWRPDAASAVVTLTHDPKLDDPALDAALRSEAFYVAALGSRRTHAARLERLRAMGHDEAALARVRGPAGLDIGASGPTEIALSIAAQLTAVRRGRA